MITTYLQWVAIAGLLALRLYDGRRIAKLEARAERAAKLAADQFHITDKAILSVFKSVEDMAALSVRQTALLRDTVALFHPRDAG